MNRQDVDLICAHEPVVLLHLVVGYHLASVGLPEPFFDLRDEAQSLDGVLERRCVRERLQCIDGALFLGGFYDSNFTTAGFSGFRPRDRRGSALSPHRDVSDSLASGAARPVLAYRPCRPQTFATSPDSATSSPPRQRLARCRHGRTLRSRRRSTSTSRS